jgi:hypothetical protein
VNVFAYLCASVCTCVRECVRVCVYSFVKRRLGEASLKGRHDRSAILRHIQSSRIQPSGNLWMWKKYQNYLVWEGEAELALRLAG